MRRRSPHALVALAAALAMAACGGDGSGDEDGFSEQAQDICLDSDAQLDRIRGAGTPAQRLERTQPVVEQLRRRLGELDPPADKQRAYEEFMAQLDELLGLVDRTKRAATRGDQQQTVALGRKLQSVQAQARKAANDAGMAACA